MQFNKYTHTELAREREREREGERDADTDTDTHHKEEDTPMLGADTRRLGGRYAGRTDLIPLR